MIYYTRWNRLKNKLTGLSCSKIEDFPGSYSKILLGSARYFLVSTFLSGGPHSFLPGSNTHISMKEEICRSSCWSKSCDGGSQTNHFCFSYPALTCQANPSLDRCPWPSAGGGTPSVVVGGPATATAPGSRRCPSGSWRAACRCVSWVQGVTWWRWTGFGHLFHRGGRHRRWEAGGQAEEMRPQTNWKDCFPEALTVVDDGVCGTVCVRIVIICRERNRKLLP